MQAKIILDAIRILDQYALNMRMVNRFQLSSLIFLFVLWGCGKAPVATPGLSELTSSNAEEKNVDCEKNNLTQIAVGDGFLKQLCGCKESDGKYHTVEKKHSFQCSLKKSNTVIFYFINIQLPHQMIQKSVDSSKIALDGFNPTPPVFPLPKNEQSIQVFPITFKEAGSFHFEDSFNSGIGGTFIVSDN